MERREVTLDPSFVVKPRDTVAQTTVSRGNRSNIVRTELSPSQSVNASQQGQTAHQSPDLLMRDPTIDAQCQSLLDREREQRERRRARKDEALIRQRAYGRNAEKTEISDTPDDTPHADFQV
jgi:protein subunit release factor B